MQLAPPAFDAERRTFGHEGALHVFGDLIAHTLTTTLSQQLRVDVIETDCEFRVAADVPGVALKDVRLEVDTNNVLHVVAVRGADENDGGLVYHRSERASGRQSCSIKLPSHADALGITATLEQGVLSVSVPKVAGTEHEASRRITISPLGMSSTARSVINHFAALTEVVPGMLLAGKTALVTGTSSGLGLETAKALSYAGCRVLATARNPGAVQEAMAKYIDADSDGYRGSSALVTVLPLDLESLASVRKLAATALAAAPALDFVVCNAGIVSETHEVTQHGFEKTLGVNHFGHHYLMSLLRDRLVAQPKGARVVFLSSKAHAFGNIDVADLHFKNRAYSMWSAYCQSKLAVLLDAKELGEQLVNTDVVVVSAHPGVIETPIATHVSLMRSSASQALFRALLVNKTVPQGAATTLYGLLEPSLVVLRGAYLSDCAVKETRRPGLEAEALDTIKRKALWDVTEEQLRAALAKVQ